MSGGHFDYIQYRLHDAVQRVENTIERYVECEDDWCKVSKETIDVMLDTHRTVVCTYHATTP